MLFVDIATSCELGRLPFTSILYRDGPRRDRSRLLTAWGLQYVFAITSGVGFSAGGEVYLSQDYGSSWKNLTSELAGELARCEARGAVWFAGSDLEPLSRRPHGQGQRAVLVSAGGSCFTPSSQHP